MGIFNAYLARFIIDVGESAKRATICNSSGRGFFGIHLKCALADWPNSNHSNYANYERIPLCILTIISYCNADKYIQNMNSSILPSLR